ncbi:MAG: 16S rRNA (guanine(966)-N(2))-methyltransferase RsmD [Clostridia bacterium]|nr:16S rRNA (guanine(966)-N(2))-methyltransferase RsmD [Clostridia bacterium]
MRIISGKVRGLTLKTIDGDSTRPTRDMVREAVFSILMNHVPECYFLDLFAGSGAMGIEALSRGAKFSMFIDLNPKCVKVIKENLEKAKYVDSSEVYNTDYKKALNKLNEEMFDIIYVDPPYNKEMGIDAINVISEKNILKEDGIIVLETDTNEYVPEVIRKV